MCFYWGRYFYPYYFRTFPIQKISPQSMILAGVALSALFSGGTTLIQYFADDVEVAAVDILDIWRFGAYKLDRNSHYRLCQHCSLYLLYV